MSADSAIEWTDATWNPTVGCSIVSPGCTNCYAMKVADGLQRRFNSKKYAGLTKTVNGNAVWTGEVRLDDDALLQPLKWRRPKRIFVNSMSDLFHESLSDSAILRVLDVIRRCSYDGGSNTGLIGNGAEEHTFQVLTKRAARMATFMRRLRFNSKADTVFKGETGLYLADDSKPPVVMKNLWLGVSCERQQEADERIPHLLQTPAAVRFVSAEPLLGPIDLERIKLSDGHGEGAVTMKALTGWYGGSSSDDKDRLDWVIVGGESGPKARPMHPGWARLLRDQCAAAGVAFFFKQWGEFAPTEVDLSEWLNQRDPRRLGERVVCGDGTLGGFPDHDVTRPIVMRRVGKKAAGRLLDGREHNAFPGV